MPRAAAQRITTATAAPQRGAFTVTTRAVGASTTADRGPQQERGAGDREPEEELHEVPGGGGPEGADDDAGGVVRAPEHGAERAYAGPHEDAVQQEHAGNAHARRQLQRVVVRVVGHGHTAGVAHVFHRLELGEHEAERVGAPPEHGPLLDGGDRRLPDLRARLAAAGVELEDRGEALAEVHDVVGARETAHDDADAHGGAHARRDPVETAQRRAMTPGDDPEKQQAQPAADPGAARERGDQHQAAQAEAGPVDEPPHEVLLGERQAQRHGDGEDEEAAQQVGVAVGGEGRGWPRTAARPTGPGRPRRPGARRNRRPRGCRRRETAPACAPAPPCRRTAARGSR